MSLTPERWQQIARIYELAVDHDPSTRDAYLSEACAGDEVLRREVESLLRHEAEQIVLDRPIAATAALLFNDASDLRPGATLGPHRIEAPLGAGGMGEVFRGVDTRLNRRVAIKVLPDGVALDPRMRARFAREAEAVAALAHPHICTLYDVGRHDEIDFLVMEYLEGDTLATRLADGPLPLALALTHANEIASALDHAHGHGVIHRDLKPANIMLTTVGAKLLDFGLAKFRPAADIGLAAPDEPRTSATVKTQGHEPGARDDEQLTHGGSVPGTVRYMAPEQIRGAEVDARSDLFSFGAVLYEMLTGRQAFDGDSAAAVRLAILEQQPPPVSSLQPSVPAAVDRIVCRCLVKDRDERWQTAGELLAELKRAAEASTPSRPRTGAVWKWAAAMLMIAVTGLSAWLLTGGAERESTVRLGSGVRSIAVLPFEDLSGDPEQEYFADGMTEQLIAELAKIRGLRTISHTSVMQYRTARKVVPTIARELGVDAIIEGSVVRAGDTVRVTAQLIRGTSGEIIWAESYERDLREVMALQLELARTIIREVDITLTPQDQARLASGRAVDPEVHLQVLLGRYHVAKATQEGVRKAIQYFSSAIAGDPVNATAHAGLSEAYVALSGFYVHPREIMPKAKHAAETALRLDESVADAHAMLGFIHLVYDWNGPAAEKELLRALDLNPTLASARLHYAAYLASQARNEESIREVQRAVDLDPLSVRTHAFGSMFLLFSRRYNDAIELARKGLELEPNHAFALAFQGLAYAELGRFDEAVTNLQRAAQRDENPTIAALHAHVLAVSGQKEQAKNLILELEKKFKDRYFCPYEIGHVYVSLGEPDTAYKWFRKGVGDRADCMAWLGVEPWIDPFRTDRRYVSLIQEVGLTSAAR